MSDVRLTATNPEDSSAVPVACNAKGELLLEAIPDQSFDGDLDGDLTVSGSASFAGTVYSAGDASTDQNGWYASPSQIGVQTKSVAPSSTCFASHLGAATAANRTIEFLANGSATFAGDVYCEARIGCGVTAETESLAYGLTSRNNFDASSNASAITAQNFNSIGRVWCGINSTGTTTSEIFGSGAADFQGEIIVGSRGKQWTLTEQSGLCHMVEVTRAATADLVEPDEPKYPKLRDVFHELDLIEQALEQVMTQLRLDPPAGWPVWDGSDNLSGTD